MQKHKQGQGMSFNLKKLSLALGAIKTDTVREGPRQRAQPKCLSQVSVNPSSGSNIEN